MKERNRETEQRETDVCLRANHTYHAQHTHTHTHTPLRVCTHILRPACYRHTFLYWAVAHLKNLRREKSSDCVLADRLVVLAVSRLGGSAPSLPTLRGSIYSTANPCFWDACSFNSRLFLYSLPDNFSRIDVLLSYPLCVCFPLKDNL